MRDGMLAMKSRHGSVMMEMVVICVLIAAACVIAMIVFGRAIVRNTDLMDKGVVGRGNRAGEVSEQYRKDAADDIKEAVKFNGEFSDTKE